MAMFSLLIGSVAPARWPGVVDRACYAVWAQRESGVGSAEDREALDSAVRESAGHVAKPLDVALGRPRRELGICQIEAPAAMKKEVGLARAVAPKPQRPGPTCVVLLATKLGEHHGLPQRAAEGCSQELPSVLDPHEERAESGVREVELWGLHEGLGAIGKPRLEQDDLVRGLEH